MKTFILKMPAEEIVHLLRAETESAEGQPELNTCVEKDYVIEEDFDRAAYGIRDGEEFDLARSEAALTIEPRVEMGYWVLETSVERPLGPVRVSEEDALVREDLTLDDFEVELQAPSPKKVEVRLHAQTAEARRDFDRWLAGMRARHPWTPAALQPGNPPPMTRETARGKSAAERAGAAAPEGDGTREAVGLFANPDILEAAVDALEGSGFDRAAISVLATDSKAREKVARYYRTIKEAEDGAAAPRTAFVSKDSRTEGEAAVVGIPLYMGGLAGAAAVAATGGALAFAIGITILGSAAGAGLGAILAASIARHHTAQVQEQLRKGGLVLWVSVPTPEDENRAVAILEKTGARDVHVHEIAREQVQSELPRKLFQADPFLLESDRI
jgi:hypothetical protein